LLAVIRIALRVRGAENCKRRDNGERAKQKPTLVLHIDGLL
jgi:hypothetical protein